MIDIDKFSYSFDSLKKFNTGSYIFHFPSKIHFGQLEDLTIFTSVENNQKFIKLILDNKDTLKRVNMITYLNNEDILQLINDSLRLTYMQFSCEKTVSIESIYQLIENSEHLMEFNINFASTELQKTASGLLSERFGREWEITGIPSYFIKLHRKQ